MKRSLNPVLAVLFALSLCLTPLAGGVSTEAAPQAPQATTAPNCVTSRISASSDDAEERDDTGAVDLDGDSATRSLQMYRLYSGSSTSTLNWWGLRFLNVDVPQGAMIASAAITFRASADSVTTASGMTLWGQLAVNSGTFTTSTNNITSRPRTTATAAWSVPQWMSGSDYATPSTLATIVQEIVDQSGWAANNALVIIGQTTVTQNRRAISRDGTDGATLAPLLEVCYSPPPPRPTITTVGTLTFFGAPPGIASAAQTYTVSGSNLEEDIVITPPAGFEVSTEGSTYSSSLTLTQSGGSVASTAVYVRLYSVTEGIFSGSIAHTSSGATPRNVAVSGRVGYCSTANLVVAEDTHIRSGYVRPSFNYGGSTTLRVNPYFESGSADGQLTGALLKWDSSGARIPADATVSAASLSFYVTDGSNYAYSLYNMRRAWVEGTNNGAPGTGASWNYYGAGTGSWGTTGAQNTASDRYDMNLWDATASNFNTTGSVTFDLNTSGLAVVQGWIAGSDNYGLTIQNYSGTTTDVWEAASSEATTEANRPKLNISYCASASPTISINGTLTAFSSSPEVPSTEQSYTVSGYNLTADIVVTAPADFEISTTSESDFGSSLTLLQSGGSVAATTIYVRFNRGTLGTSSGNNTHTSSGATTKNVVVSGTASPANHAPDPPVLVQPADDVTGVSTSPSLEVTVTDPDSDTMNVSFYGRAAGETTGEDFTIMALPDTQNYSTAYPEVFNSQTQWIAANKTAQNIVFVTHLGDIVNIASSTTEYNNADAAMDLLDAGNVAYSVGPGNHDYPLTNYNLYFGVSRFSGKSWYGGNYNSSNENNYSLFSASGMDFILINLEYHPGTAAMDWADALLKANSTRRGIVVSHSIIDVDDINWTYPAVYTALKDNPNLFLMLCGHMHTPTDGAARRTETGDNGNTIYILQSDYQDYAPYWGNGYLRIMRFSPAVDKIYVTTYSPYLPGSLTDAQNQFELAYDMAAPPTFELSGTVSGVASGGSASISWPGRAPGAEYVWYVVSNDGTMTTTSSTWSFTTNAAPVITESDPQAVTMSEDGAPTPFGLTLHATDADNDTLTWSISTPASHGSASASGTGASKDIGYTPTNNYNGADSFVVQVSDGNGGSDTITVNVTIGAVNDAPLLDSVGNQTVVAGTLLAFDASASDPDIPIQTLTFSLADGAPDGATIDPDTGVFTWTPTEAQVNTHSVIVRVSDGALNDEETIQVTVLAPLAVTALALRQSPDKAAWSPVTGDLAGGCTLPLDSVPASWYYLDVASLTANRALADGYYGFTLGQSGLPAGWLTYWAAKGVVSGAPGWQGVMWQIINGDAPIFYLKVSGGAYTLVDGLGKALNQPDDYLRVNGDYLLGVYSYSGSVSDTVGGRAAVTAKMTFIGSGVPVAPALATHDRRAEHLPDVAGCR